jgi:hypothetical protein
VAFFFVVYDVGADQLFGRWFARKGADNMIAMLRLVRSRYPGQAIGSQTPAPRPGVHRLKTDHKQRVMTYTQVTSLYSGTTAVVDSE